MKIINNRKNVNLIVNIRNALHTYSCSNRNKVTLVGTIAKFWTSRNFKSPLFSGVVKCILVSQLWVQVRQNHYTFGKAYCRINQKSSFWRPTSSVFNFLHWNRCIFIFWCCYCPGTLRFKGGVCINTSLCHYRSNPPWYGISESLVMWLRMAN